MAIIAIMVINALILAFAKITRAILEFLKAITNISQLVLEPKSVYGISMINPLSATNMLYLYLTTLREKQQLFETLRILMTTSDTFKNTLPAISKLSRMLL
ncbi:hypothetical protein C2G38_2167858 [Gigaspora rosea]|uniref:Uncharacterized protein n=1 Tax=Gigaspora rosea TaxID=44941 RepID=A0A397VXJ1_9GLOM|nr:hypothetical protein C2G38_2167858 [Gigaspora rosea]